MSSTKHSPYTPETERAWPCTMRRLCCGSPPTARAEEGLTRRDLTRWGGPKRENRTERDGTSECYRWLAKDDLMTKTGYGYAKCLTVAGTATSSYSIFLPLRC